MALGNLLKLALKMVPKQTVLYYRFLSRTTNAIGVQAPIYADPVEISGSFQAVPKSLYEDNGLDFSKEYATFYALTEVVPVKRGKSGDKIVYAGKSYQVESDNDWFPINGWKGLLLIATNDA